MRGGEGYTDRMRPNQRSGVFDITPGAGDGFGGLGSGSGWGDGLMGDGLMGKNGNGGKWRFGSEWRKR